MDDAKEQIGGDAKIPSIIYYDKEGKVKGIGAEALDVEDWVLDSEDGEGGYKAEW